jgi:MoaA/NifB/PqqE/SkfB family radical SAM enzyme
MIFQGIDHEIQRLYIHWDITTVCNYKCSYCYALLDYEERKKWNKEASLETINLILKALKIRSLPMFLGLLGGEPTLSKHYFYILEELQKDNLGKFERDRLYITTNLSRSIEWWREHPKLKNTFILASFHPQYHNKESIKEFIEKLLYLKDYFKVKLNIMLYEKYKNVLFELLPYIQELKNNNVIIHPHIIYPEGSPFLNPSDSYKEFKDFFDFQDPEYIFNNQKLTDFEVFSQGLNKFKNWKCYQNNFEISLDGKVSRICWQKQYDLKEDIFYFKKIKEIKPKKCIQEFCSCDGLLKCKKVKD